MNTGVSLGHRPAPRAGAVRGSRLRHHEWLVTDNAYLSCRAGEEREGEGEEGTVATLFVFSVVLKPFF